MLFLLCHSYPYSPLLITSLLIVNSYVLPMFLPLSLLISFFFLPPPPPTLLLLVLFLLLLLIIIVSVIIIITVTDGCLSYLPTGVLIKIRYSPKIRRFRSFTRSFPIMPATIFCLYVNDWFNIYLRSLFEFFNECIVTDILTPCLCLGGCLLYTSPSPRD